MPHKTPAFTLPPGVSREHITTVVRVIGIALLASIGAVIGLAIPFGALRLYESQHGTAIIVTVLVAAALVVAYQLGRYLGARARGAEVQNMIAAYAAFIATNTRITQRITDALAAARAPSRQDEPKGALPNLLETLWVRSDLSTIVGKQFLFMGCEVEVLAIHQPEGDPRPGVLVKFVRTGKQFTVDL